MNRSSRARAFDSSVISDPASTPQAELTPSSLVDIAGIPVANLSLEEAMAVIEKLVLSGGSHYMTVVNAAKIVTARDNAKLRDVILNADLVTADGMSVVWASRLLGRSLKGRVTGIDMFDKLLERASAMGWSVYLLGASEESLREVAARLTTRYKTLRLAGSHNGYFGASEAGDIADEISAARADLLFVAMGSPSQEYWISENLLRSGVRFAMGVGGAFDHLSGRSRRAPRWMQDAGLEWFYRLMREPRRLWRRYLIGNSIFIWLVLRQLISRGSRPRP